MEKTSEILEQVAGEQVTVLGRRLRLRFHPNNVSLYFLAQNLQLAVKTHLLATCLDGQTTADDAVTGAYLADLTLRRLLGISQSLEVYTECLSALSTECQGPKYSVAKLAHIHRSLDISEGLSLEWEALASGLMPGVPPEPYTPPTYLGSRYLNDLGHPWRKRLLVDYLRGGGRLVNGRGGFDRHPEITAANTEVLIAACGGAYLRSVPKSEVSSFTVGRWPTGVGNPFLAALNPYAYVVREAISGAEP